MCLKRKSKPWWCDVFTEITHFTVWYVQIRGGVVSSRLAPPTSLVHKCMLIFFSILMGAASSRVASPTATGHKCLLNFFLILWVWSKMALPTSQTQGLAEFFLSWLVWSVFFQDGSAHIHRAQALAEFFLSWWCGLFQNGSTHTHRAQALAEIFLSYGCGLGWLRPHHRHKRLLFFFYLYWCGLFSFRMAPPTSTGHKRLLNGWRGWKLCSFLYIYLYKDPQELQE